MIWEKSGFIRRICFLTIGIAAVTITRDCPKSSIALMPDGSNQFYPFEEMRRERCNGDSPVIGAVMYATTRNLTDIELRRAMCMSRCRKTRRTGSVGME